MTSIELNHKQIESARKGQEVCIKIEPIPGEAPKMFGRHFEETDMLVSKVSDTFFYVTTIYYLSTTIMYQIHVISIENVNIIQEKNDAI